MAGLPHPQEGTDPSASVGLDAVWGRHLSPHKDGLLLPAGGAGMNSWPRAGWDHQLPRPQARMGPPRSATGLGRAGWWGAEESCLCALCWDCLGTPGGQSQTQLLPREPAFPGARPAGAVSPVGTEPTVRGRQALRSQGTRPRPRKATSSHKAGRGGSGLGAFAGKGIWLGVVVPGTVLGHQAHPRPISSTAPSAPPGASELCATWWGGGSVCFIAMDPQMEINTPVTFLEKPIGPKTSEQKTPKAGEG